MAKIKIEYPKLPLKFKSKWISALRSGEYEQTKGTLCKISEGNTSYCCLGVAGRIAGNTVNSMRNYNVLDHAGVFRGIPNILKGFHTPTIMKLTIINDDEGKSFKQIAIWIEKNM